MSEKHEESRTPSVSVDSVLDALEDWYHVPALGAVLAFMFWVRVQSWENFTRDGKVYFSGNDAYYHFRQVSYTVENWPATMPFDPWTGFPEGVLAGQFGTLFDQLVATAALVVGLGSPSENTVAMTLLFAPAVFGTLLAIPVYFIGKRLGGRLGGVFAAVVLAFLPGYFLQRSVVGAADHNGAEPLFMSLAVLGTMVALALAEREKPVYEQFVDRDTAGLRGVVGWSVLAGAATAVYMWVWPPGVLLVGIFGAFYLVKLVSDYYSGNSPEHVAVVGAISMTVTGVLMLAVVEETGFGVSGFSYLQPFFSFAVAFGCVFLAAFARVWDEREFGAAGYVGATFVILAVGIGAVGLVLPDLLSMVQHNLLRFVGFSSGAATRTIGEAQPFLSRTSRYGLGMGGVIFLEYGLAFFTALLGAAWILLRPHLASGNLKRMAGAAVAVAVVMVVFAAPGLGDFVGGVFGIDGQLGSLGIVLVTLTAVTVTGEYEGEELLVVVWGAFVTSAAFTQVRFNYYLVVPVVVLNAYFLGTIVAAVDLDRPASQLEDVDWYQVGTVVMVALLVLVPVAAPAVAGATNNDSARGSASPVSLANDQNQRVPLQGVTTIGASQAPGAVTSWDDAMSWFDENAPEQGTYGGAENADEMEYYGTYSQTDDFDYPEGAYGVMSWWDYGHWMTVQGETVPHANPFQQHATSAANYLLAQNETQANDVLADNEEDDAKIRYTAVDWKMVMPPLPSLGSGDAKFSAPVTFYDGPRDFTATDFYKQAITADFEDGQPTNARYFQQAPLVKQQAYYDSMMVRLYRYHGSAKAPQPVVLDWERDVGESAIVFDSNDTTVRQFDNMTAAEEFVEEDGTAQIGGFGDSPSEYVPALEHYRMVGVSDESAAPANLWLQRNELNPQYYPTWVKLFERVEGATIEGTGPANETLEVTAQFEITEMRNEEGRAPTFPYTQRVETDADGNFELTVPYSTTGYDEYGPENGHTNVSVRADGPYTVTTGNTTAGDDVTTVEWNATTHVTEGQVLGENGTASTVELERHVVDEPEGAQNDTADNASAMASPSTVESVESTEGAADGDAVGSGIAPLSAQSPFGPSGAAAAVAAAAVGGALARRHT
ncbi:oligosaccharyl transferase, archaeosortase A system-associated [Halobacterium yunchengense]|uniref:oligosaccharyl transferase, archaeosortase A system-associated n=1 Tax=Halobacterium yunchengense TaxID=3108497 RepID=UPI00300A4D16